MTIGVQDRVAEATAVAEEAFSQIRTVQSFVQEPAERERYGERIAASVRTAISARQGAGRLLRDAHLLDLRGDRLRAVAGRPAGAGRASSTAGALVAFLLYTITIAASIGALATSFSSYQEAVGAAERVFEILEMTPRDRGSAARR